MFRSFASGVASLALLVSGCAEPSSPAPVQAAQGGKEAAATAGSTRDGTLVELEGRHGKPGSLWIVAGYKVKREGGKLTKTLEIEIEDAPKGTTYPLSLDGFNLAKLVTNSKGEVEYEMSASEARPFPQGFKEPAEGSILHVGDLAEVRLLTLHKEADLQVEIVQGKLSGKVGYKVERLGETVTTEFQVKVSSAAKGVHPVKIDGVHVGDLTVDAGGKGKLLYSTLVGEAFPDGFPAPKAGGKIQVGTLFEGVLADDLAR